MSWNVKVLYFSNLGPCFSKYTFLMLEYFSCLALIQSAQSCQWWFESIIFILLLKRFLSTENTSFSWFHDNHCQGNKFLQTIVQLINPNCPWKNGFKHIKTTQKKLLLLHIYLGRNAAKRFCFVFWIFTSICYVPEWIWLV